MIRLQCFYVILGLYLLITNEFAFANPAAAAPPSDTKALEQSFHQKRISLNFQDIEVRAVLQVLAEFAGINMVVSDTVKGKITLSLNNVAWDHALSIILRTQSLEKRLMGRVLFIAPTDEISHYEKKVQESKLELKNLAPLKSQLITINYAKVSDIASILQDKKEAFLSPRGQLIADPRTNTLWVQDSASRLATIRKIIKQFDVPVKQVLIEARIVNVTKDVAQDLGLHFSISKPGLLSSLRAQGQNLEASSSLAERLNFDFGNLAVPSSPVSIGVALAKLGDGILLDLELSALESEGRGEVISSPRLITTNQQPALIESGEEIPYQESTSSGATAVSFKKAVLSLKVTPQITPDAKILMDLKINQDIPTPKVFNGVPTILTKEIQTKILANNCQTIVLGGIYKQDKNNEINRVPFLGELPLLGGLFRNRAASIRNEELLIFITPRIITNYSLPKHPNNGRQNVVRGVKLVNQEDITRS
ncbi:type IV pilus secretin PilQ [Legionella jordanis]|uniref:Type IV pilus (Tfp) assembly protein PilQ n=1 Tax=Legionella jordanis TaxID=456 RepID=A0A0W0V8F6_9GAMM|nr:type IV pilus secretin PilQ [Legionella jordanis]KTD16419.1 type IV pilus (Tfp) assembly protein PilQ [Legionella jordanis]RMX04379.1 type IV pilus secretin PilQ [Legionella jordanis]RMX15570.1 type IV pilus secretin PilQ [Legionella jordanis]VEH12121.1 type IV pilus assembly protein PilQ [Legionella jordanis]